MTGAAVRLLVAAALGALALTGAGPVGAALAADDDILVLPGETGIAITGDVDGDAAREVVRVVEDAGSTTGPHLEVLRHDGGWDVMGTTRMVRRDARDTRIVPVDPALDAFGLLAWRDGRRERVLFAAGRVLGPDGGICCLSLAELVPDDSGVTLRPMEGGIGEAQSITVLDTDADGVEELAVMEPTGGTVALGLRLLRWDGRAWSQQRVEVPTGQEGFPQLMTGESDGVPGEEVILGPSADQQFVRVSVRDGRLVEERDPVFSHQAANSWIAGIADGAVVTVMENELRVLRWPRGEAVRTAASTSVSEFPNAWLVDGEGGAVLVLWASFGPATRGPTARVLDLDLHLVAEIASSEAVERLFTLPGDPLPALRNVPYNIYPYLGELPGGLADGADAVLSAGSLLFLAADGSLEVEPIGAMAGQSPVGLAGPGGRWIVLADQWLGDRASAFFWQYSAGVGSLTIAPTALAMTPEADGGVLDVELDGHAFVPSPVGERLVTTDGGFRATVSAPVGSLLLVAAEEDILHDERLTSGTATVTIAPRRAREGNQPFDAGAVLLTPAGQAYTASWQAEILRVPPELTLSADTELWRATATVRGTTAPGATVEVDGQAVAVRPDGSFVTSVEAPLWPRGVEIVATDPVGNATVERTSVVGFFDYRGLPWVPIVIGMTLVLGLVLFLRTPRRRENASPLYDDARLEEIEET